MPEQLRVVIAEPNDQLRGMAIKRVNQLPGFRVVEAAHSVEQATSRSFLVRLEDLRPHVAIISERFGRGDGGGEEIAAALEQSALADIAYVAWGAKEPPDWAMRCACKKQHLRESVQELAAVLLAEEATIRRSVNPDRQIVVHTQDRLQLLAELAGKEFDLWSDHEEELDTGMYADREFLNSY